MTAHPSSDPFQKHIQSVDFGGKSYLTLFLLVPDANDSTGSISWHQMFRSFLTGHASLIVDATLPFASRYSAVSRYTRLMIAFLISGLIHARADQLMGVPNGENGAVGFFLLHAAIIMLEDTLGTAFSGLLPARVCYLLGYIWVCIFFAWSSPTWTYSGIRLGLSPTALLPVRVVGPWIKKLYIIA